MEMQLDLQNQHDWRRMRGVIVSLREKKKKVKYRFTICELRARRSDRANAYYWAVVMPAAAQALTETQGETYDADAAHEFFKAVFLAKPVIDRRTGELLAKVPGSSAVLDTAQFTEYVEQVRTWLAEYCGVVVPDPSRYETTAATN